MKRQNSRTLDLMTTTMENTAHLALAREITSLTRPTISQEMILLMTTTLKHSIMNSIQSMTLSMTT
jgi:hypothetical protein